MNFTENKEELKKVVNTRKDTLAHVQAQEGWTTEDTDTLKLKDYNNWSVAHVQAWRGWVTEDLSILKLRDSDGWAVAHVQVWKAKEGWVTEDPKILKVKGNNGYTVAYEQIENGWTPPEHLKNVKINGETIWEIYSKQMLEVL